MGHAQWVLTIAQILRGYFVEAPYLASDCCEKEQNEALAPFARFPIREIPEGSYGVAS